MIDPSGACQLVGFHPRLQEFARERESIRFGFRGGPMAGSSPTHGNTIFYRSNTKQLKTNMFNYQ